MAETTGVPGDPANGVADPFVVQVNWLLGVVGGKDALVQRCGGRVSARTLDNWTAGNYPRAKVTGAVRDVDAWATANVPGYPTAAGVPRLVDSCGPYRTVPVPGAAAPEPADPEEVVPGPVAGRPRGRRWERVALSAATLVLVAAASSVVTLVVDHHEDQVGAVEAARSAASAPLPSTGNGQEYTEQAGHIGANTFADPRTLLDGSQRIPPSTTIQVRCRYYAPSVPSVTPDGFWYLIDSPQWAGRWTPANSYMNGDVPGGPSLHNTDLAVPICR